jgi:hypothetical protein
VLVIGGLGGGAMLLAHSFAHMENSAIDITVK